MRDIIYQVCCKMPEAFFRFNIFLAAYMAITAMHFSPAV